MIEETKARIEQEELQKISTFLILIPQAYMGMDQYPKKTIIKRDKIKRSLYNSKVI